MGSVMAMVNASRAAGASRTGSSRLGVGCGRPGFTLIELIAVIAVTTVIGGLGGMMVLEASRTRASASARAELADAAARAMEQMVRYVREIPQDSSLSGKAQIATAEAAQVRWGNYGFRLNGATLEMTVDNGSNWRPAAKEATSLSFTYLDANGSALSPLPLSAANREAVRRIRLNLQLSRDSESVAVQTGVYLRAFMNEVTQ